MISACTFGITAVAMVMVPLCDRGIVPRGILRRCAKLNNAQSLFEDACVRLLLKRRAIRQHPSHADLSSRVQLGTAFLFAPIIDGQRALYDSGGNCWCRCGAALNR